MYKLPRLEEGAILSIEDYVRAFGDEKFRAVVADMLSSAHGPIRLHQLAKHGSESEMPLLRVIYSHPPQAEGITGMIRISHGMIMHCLTTPIFDIPYAAGTDDFVPYLIADPLLPRRIMLSWVMLHEHMHAERKHGEFVERYGTDTLTDRALEHDADLCAAASIYRAIQTLIPRESALQRRVFVLICIFWGLRTLTTFCQRSTHSPVALRVWEISNKLALLIEDPADQTLPDLNGQDQDFIDRAKHLFTAVLRAEQVFQSLPGYLQTYGDLRRDLDAEIPTNAFLAVHMRWGEIRLRVAELVGGKDYEVEMQSAPMQLPLPDDVIVPGYARGR